MSVEDRAFNAQFERASAHSLPSPEGDAIDADFADFDKFFERLSSLDDMNWSSEPQERDIVPLKPGILRQDLPDADAAYVKEALAPDPAPRTPRRRRESRKPKAFFTTVMPKAADRQDSAAADDDLLDPPTPRGAPASNSEPMVDPAVQAQVDALPEIEPPHTESPAASVSASLDAVTDTPPAPARPATRKPERKEAVLPGTMGAHNGKRRAFASATGTVPVSEESGRNTRLGAGPVIKLGLLGVLLFGLGMVGVWAALSLPAHLGQAMPRLAALLHTNNAALEDVNPRLASATAPAPAATQEPVRMEEIELPGQTTPKATAPRTAPAAPVRRITPPAPAQPAAPAVAMSAPVAPAAPRTVRELPSAPTPIHTQTRNVPVVPVTPAAPAPQATASAPVAAAAPATLPDSAPRPAAAAAAPAPEVPEAGFAVQVGACSSATCVENYRTLLVQHVPSSDIQVIRAEGTAVQRVRVAPLTRNEAEEVKSMLAASDPRLQNAYVLTLH